MANTKSAQKAVRSSARKAKSNQKVVGAFKSARKDYISSLTKDKSASAGLLSKSYKAIDKAAKSKAIHKKTAARYKSRLAKAASKVS